MTNEKQNNEHLQQNSNVYKARNSQDIEFQQIHIHDNHWITERGGSNDEPAETPSERPHL